MSLPVSLNVIPDRNRQIHTNHVSFTTSNQTYMDVAKSVAVVALKIAIFPWGIYELTKYILQRAIMAVVYPAQNCLQKKLTGQNQSIQNVVNLVIASGWQNIVERVVLEKNGLRYTGWTISNPAQKNNGKWVLQAAGNGAVAADYIPIIGKQNMDVGFNTFILDNPGVGESQGTSTPETMGEVQSLGMTYLETIKKAKKIAFAGHSLGGAAMGQMSLCHTFKHPQVQYIAIQQMTFGNLSHLAKKIVKQSLPWFKSVAPYLIRWTGLEMNSQDASLKLAEEGIPEFIINRKRMSPSNNEFNYIHDGVIPGNATLAHRLNKANIIHLKTSHLENTDFDFDHFSEDPFTITAQILANWNSLH